MHHFNINKGKLFIQSMGSGRAISLRNWSWDIINVPSHDYSLC